MQNKPLTDERQPSIRKRDPVERLALGQAAYFLVTGIWPQISLRTFERLTGPKTDDWLVKSVGLQVSVVGAALALAAKRRRLTPEVELLAAGSALGLGVIDVVYASRGRISPIYLLDAVIEFGIVAGWATLRQQRGTSTDYSGG